MWVVLRSRALGDKYTVRVDPSWLGLNLIIALGFKNESYEGGPWIPFSFHHVRTEFSSSLTNMAFKALFLKWNLGPSCNDFKLPASRTVRNTFMFYVNYLSLLYFNSSTNLTERPETRKLFLKSFMTFECTVVPQYNT